MFQIPWHFQVFKVFQTSGHPGTGDICDTIRYQREMCAVKLNESWQIRDGPVVEFFQNVWAHAGASAASDGVTDDKSFQTVAAVGFTINYVKHFLIQAFALTTTSDTATLTTVRIMLDTRLRMKLGYSIGTCNASRFDSNANQPFRFDSKVMGRFASFRISCACPLLVVVKWPKPLTALSGAVYSHASSMSDHTPALRLTCLRIGIRNL